MIHMDVSENNGAPKSFILIGFSIIFTIHFGVPLFLEIPISEKEPFFPQQKVTFQPPICKQRWQFSGGDFM